MNKHIYKVTFLFIFFYLRQIGFASVHSDMANRISNDCAKELYREEKLQLYGGGGAFNEGVNQIDAYYRSSAKMNVNEARKLYIKVITKYLSRINSDIKIRPYLHDYPFTIKNLEIDLSFEKEGVSKDCVALVSYVKNKIFYSSYDRLKGEYQDLIDETYEEAIQRVLSSDCDCNPSSNPSIESPALIVAPQ